MAIDKAYIVSEVARRTERNLADVTDAEISAAVLAASIRIPNLVAECTTETVAGQAAYELDSFPKYFKRVESVRVEGSTNKDGLVEIKSFDDYQTAFANQSQNDTPTSFIVWGNYMYLFPTPDATYTLRLFAQVFESNASVIELPTTFTEAIISLTAYQVLASKGQGLGEEAQSHMQNAERWLAMLERVENNKIRPDNVDFNDI